MDVRRFLEEPGADRRRLDRLEKILDCMKDTTGYVGPRMGDAPVSRTNSHSSPVETTVCRLDDYYNAIEETKAHLALSYSNVENAINRISDLETRAIMKKAHLFDMKYEAIATTFEISLSTVKRRLKDGDAIVSRSPEYKAWLKGKELLKDAC